MIPGSCTDGQFVIAYCSMTDPQGNCQPSNSLIPTCLSRSGMPPEPHTAFTRQSRLVEQKVLVWEPRKAPEGIARVRSLQNTPLYMVSQDAQSKVHKATIHQSQTKRSIQRSKTTHQHFNTISFMRLCAGMGRTRRGYPHREHPILTEYPPRAIANSNGLLYDAAHK